eukprot:NODE_22478_length_706_cov_4.435233.p1 GENE.NODE_22478_length_706_cov_4.435233~~NODE_22478_length_706_cov_4.435233.p1  ORF type:complete len:215 (-),score=70.98 NODE_22478_length_706_cov_4.435233:62-634(-)
MSVVGTIYDDVYINVAVASIVVIVMITGFAVLLRPVIAGVNTFFVIQTSLTLSLDGGAFYFLTDDETAFPEGPHFSIVFYATILGVISSIFSLIGIYTYQQHWKNWKYQSLIVVTNLVVAALSLCDCILYSRMNLRLHLPDHMFVFGSTALQTAVYQWMWVPGVVIMAQLCPKNMEATMYALLAGCKNRW